MSAPNPALVAAAPSLISAIQAFQQFENDMGPNPLLWPGNYLPAKLKLVGALGLLLPGVLTAEGGVLVNLLNTQGNTWIKELQAVQAAAAAAAASPTPATPAPAAA
jgi:hypothetical protein